MQTRKTFLKRLVAAAAGLSIIRAPWAQEGYPSRPVQVWVGFPGGGALDVATRVVTGGLADEGIRPIVIMNKPGASGIIASTQVAHDRPDGYSLLLSTSANMAIAQYVYSKPGFDARDDFVPVARFAVGQNVIYAGSRTGVRTFEQMVAMIRKEPGKLNFASPGRGTTPHLCFEMLKSREKLYIVHVPFHGSPAALTAVAGGDVEFGIDAIGPTKPFFASGRLIALAQTGEHRSAALPGVPTLKELGFDGIPDGTFLGLSAPASTPDVILERLRQALARTMANPSIVRQLADVGFDAGYLPGSQFEQAIQRESAIWAAAVKYAGITPT